MFEQKKFFLFIAVAAVLVFAYFNQNLTEDHNELPLTGDLNIVESRESQENGKKSEEIIVHLSGAVKNAGVYKLQANSRLVDLLKVAGGLKEEADLKKINLAEEIFDGQKIIIPELINNNLNSFPKDQLQIREDFYNDNYSNFGSQTELININQASQSDLEALNGIGPAKASAILKYRKENGHFAEKEDLLKVSGIGEKTLSNIEAEIRLR